MEGGSFEFPNFREAAFVTEPPVPAGGDYPPLKTEGIYGMCSDKEQIPASAGKYPHREAFRATSNSRFFLFITTAPFIRIIVWLVSDV